MKKLLLFCLTLFSCLFFYNCEKDDICIESSPNTPSLVISFFDKDDLTEPKNVENVLLVANGLTKSILYNEVSSISVPLQTTADQTQYSLIKNYNPEDTASQNEDNITINYQRQDLFISRACGYITVFSLDETNGIELETDSDNWINSIEIIETNIINKDSTHVKIYF